MNRMAFSEAPAPQKGLHINFVIAVAVVVVAAAISYFFFFKPGPRADVRKFTGTLTAVEASTVRVKGAFYPIPEPVPENLRSTREFSFRTGDATKFWSIVLSPPWNKIAQRGSPSLLKLNELPRKEGPGSLEELKALLKTGTVFVDASFDSSILKGRSHVAATVVYRYLPRPSFE
ncbi:MAG: hypothetical protein HY434_00365 [Candidatus Liptonbacteria bacterium]|nr:hypothetical protein [Candidatus Liptonbacteria bacterium]